MLNDEQCRGQVEGGVVQALGSAMFEEIELDADGAVLTRDFRRYHVPKLGDFPRTEVLFATPTTHSARTGPNR